MLSEWILKHQYAQTFQSVALHFPLRTHSHFFDIFSDSFVRVIKNVFASYAALEEETWSMPVLAGLYANTTVVPAPNKYSLMRPSCFFGGCARRCSKSERVQHCSLQVFARHHLYDKNVVGIILSFLQDRQWLSMVSLLSFFRLSGVSRRHSLQLANWMFQRLDKADSDRLCVREVLEYCAVCWRRDGLDGLHTIRLCLQKHGYNHRLEFQSAKHNKIQQVTLAFSHTLLNQTVCGSTEKTQVVPPSSKRTRGSKPHAKE